jgi:hypothetical protein
MFLELISEGDEWLHVTSASNYLNDDVELEFDGSLGLFVWGWRAPFCFRRWCRTDEFRDSSAG